MFTEPIAIYGIFRFGVCLYVGQTINPKQRRQKHFPVFGASRFPGACFRILRWTTIEESGRIEHRMIKAYWRKGQAKYNKRATLRRRHNYANFPVYVKSVRKTFPDPASAARFLGATVGPIWKAIQSGNEWQYVPERKWANFA